MPPFFATNRFTSNIRSKAAGDGIRPVMKSSPAIHHNPGQTGIRMD